MTNVNQADPAIPRDAGAAKLLIANAELGTLPTQPNDLFSEALDSISFPRWRFGVHTLSGEGSQSVNCAGFLAVTAGTCRVVYGDGDCRRRLDVSAGDGLLLTRDAKFTIQTATDVCEKTTLVFCLFQAVETLQPLHTLIPDVSTVQWSSESQFPFVSRMIETLLDKRRIEPGWAAVTGLMHRTVLVSIIRGILAKRVQESRFDEATDNGWLSAFLDPFIGVALRAIHREPGLPWTVQKLAACSGISRSGFAARFRTFLGKPPLQYVTEFRMNRACELLTSASIDIQDVSSRLGYDSASAFSTAFKRAHGISPGAYRANAHRHQFASNASIDHNSEIE